MNEVNWRKRAKKVYRLIKSSTKSPKGTLEYYMITAHEVHQKFCAMIIDKITNDFNAKDPSLKYWYSEMVKAQERAVDCAHKLAPFKHAKLESMEVKQTVEHRMVIRSPKPVASVEEWAKITGATTKTIDKNKEVKKNFAPIVESLHDYDEDHDELETQKRLN